MVQPNRRPLVTKATYGALASAVSVVLATQYGGLPPAGALVPSNAGNGAPFAERGVDGNTVPRYPSYPPTLPASPVLPDLGPVLGNPAQAGEIAAVAGIPQTVLRAYRHSADNVNAANPGCRLPMSLLAAIGKVESDHARGGAVDANGTAFRRIVGPQLAGGGYAAIADTDGGRWDGDPRWDHAVGPMQFVPSTWQRWGTDGNGDGTADPENAFDATTAAGSYLCAAGGNLSTPDGLQRAVLAYNHSASYLGLVLAWMRVYDGGAYAVPDSLDTVGDGGAQQADHRTGPPPAQPDRPQQPGGTGGPPPERRADPVPAPPHQPTPPPGGAPGGAPLPPLPIIPALPTDPALPIAPLGTAPEPAAAEPK